jgi:hypothetical protein
VPYKSSGFKPVALANRANIFWADFFPIMEGENSIRPVGSLKHTMRTGFPFNMPADTK